MKRFYIFLIFGLYLLVARVSYAASTIPTADSIEEITQFSSHITINQDTSITIEETIEYFTPEEKHGIYRYIPEKYRKNGWIESHPIYDISVTDIEDRPMPFSTTRENGNITMKIGDPNITFAGDKTYKIKYSVSDAVLKQNGFDELYWDITGEGWQFPIQRAKVIISSPFAPPGETVCFTGPIGGTASECIIGKTNEILVTSKEPINYGENFTVAVKLDQKNDLLFPSSVEKLINKIKDNSPFLLLLLQGLALFFAWYKKGRDFRFVSPNAFNLEPDQPQGQRPLFESTNIPMVYEPLKDLTPGEAGTLLDEKVDNQDVVAEIIELARKKYLGIERVENKGFLKFGHDYLFTKFKDGPGNLPPQQEYLMKHIFNSKSEIKLSELKGVFYLHMTKVKEMIAKGLKDRKLFTANPTTARGIGMAMAIILSMGVFFVTISSLAFLGAAWPFEILFISAVVSLIFGWNMPQKTAVGTNLSLQAKGLRETIRLGKWREEIKEKHLFIEEVLPFAISLGVIGKLTKDMEKLNITPPKYMSGGFDGNTLAWGSFVSDFSKTASGGLSYNPSSSSSGGSGFSGGSSGGGGGGGGGGSW